MSSETVVYYGSNERAPPRRRPRAVARSMTGSVIMAYDPSQVADGAQVTVVTGTQFAVECPRRRQPDTVRSAASTTTTAPTTRPRRPPLGGSRSAVTGQYRTATLGSPGHARREQHPLRPWPIPPIDGHLGPGIAGTVARRDVLGEALSATPRPPQQGGSPG